MNRRNFVKNTALASTTALFVPSLSKEIMNNEDQVEKWITMLKDPAYDTFSGVPDLDHILSLYPRPKGREAFHPLVIKKHLEELEPYPEIDTGHELIDQSVRVGLAHINATFQGDHPKYGVGYYDQTFHDGFPPTIISAVDALTLWGIHSRAKQLFRYWLTHFVNNEGQINYYGASLAEYGQLLDTANKLEKRAGGSIWYNDTIKKVDLLAIYVVNLYKSEKKNQGLISGVPEADQRGEPGYYFHNNAWVSKGLKKFVDLCERTGYTPGIDKRELLLIATQLEEDTLTAIKKSWPDDPNEWWLPARLGKIEKPEFLTGHREGSYTNYRYWLELLSSEILPEHLAHRLVDARLNGGGQFCGMTRLKGWVDDWTLSEYLISVWRLKRKREFLLSLYGHISYHQCQGHLTAYEQFHFPGVVPVKPARGNAEIGYWQADYCLPCQLTVARAAIHINKR